jgi:hypothetical protein
MGMTVQWAPVGAHRLGLAPSPDIVTTSEREKQTQTGGPSAPVGNQQVDSRFRGNDLGAGMTADRPQARRGEPITWARRPCHHGRDARATSLAASGANSYVADAGLIPG